MADIPLEIKALVVKVLSPRKYDAEGKAECLRDLRAVCLVWWGTMAIVRKIIFSDICLRAWDHNVDTSLRNLCLALENDPNVAKFVQSITLSDQMSGMDQPHKSPFVRIVESPRLNCLLSFFPHMCQLRSLTLQHIQFHKLADSAQFLHALEGFPILELVLENCTFSISAFSAFFEAFGEPGGLRDLDIDGISLFPDSTESDMEDAFDVLFERTQDWDQESTWEFWDIEKPASSSFFSIDNLELGPFGDKSDWSGSMMLLDFLASNKWSPFDAIDNLVIRGSFMDCLLTDRINNIIRRYEPTLTSLSLPGFTEFRYLEGAPLYLAGVQSVEFELSIADGFAIAYEDQDRFAWYFESLSTVPPGSKLKEVELCFYVTVPLRTLYMVDEEWQQLDEVLSRLQLETLTLDVFPCNNIWTPAAKLQAWLLDVCFPKSSAKYLSKRKHAGEGGENRSVLRIWT